MSAEELYLPADPDALRALFADMHARIAASEQALEAERAAHETTRNAVNLTTLQIEKLKVQLSRLRRMKFGQSSERIAKMADQLELTLEDLEAEHAHAACAIGEPTATEDRPSTARKPKRLPLPDHLPRDETVHDAPDADGCSACGGAMGKLGEDVTEVLEYVPGRFRVVRHVRPKLACGRCDVLSQAPHRLHPCRSRAAVPVPTCSPMWSCPSSPTICRFIGSRASMRARASISAVRPWQTG